MKATCVKVGAPAAAARLHSSDISFTPRARGIGVGEADAEAALVQPACTRRQDVRQLRPAATVSAQRGSRMARPMPSTLGSTCWAVIAATRANTQPTEAP